MINNIQDKKYGIYSYYKSNISQEIVSMQSSVFKKFDFEITQIKNDKWEHFQFLNSILSDPLTPEFILFFDIDCIPLTKESISLVLQQIQDQNTIAGGLKQQIICWMGKTYILDHFLWQFPKRSIKSWVHPVCHRLPFGILAHCLQLSQNLGETSQLNIGCLVL